MGEQARIPGQQFIVFLPLYADFVEAFVVVLEQSYCLTAHDFEGKS